VGETYDKLFSVERQKVGFGGKENTPKPKGFVFTTEQIERQG
jgi:hypothetical protein